MTALLGGAANPLGSVAQFIRTPLSAVAEALEPRFAATPANAGLRVALDLLLPFESPWSRILLAPCGDWTVLVNNGLYGGDSTAPGPAIGNALNVGCVVASAVPSYGPGHEQTQLEVFGPAGEPPLICIRSLSATATDGRWQWFESGTPFEFEDVGRYTARRKRDRFDRELLLDYLEHLGIPARNDTAYGPAVLLQERAQYTRRSMTLDEARADFR
jgi:hypothetical protein